MITPLPTPPSTADSANFNVRANAFLGALPLFAEEANSLAATTIDASAIAEASAISALASQQAATASSNAIKWVSGTTYVLGTVCWSPANFLSYRKKTAAAGSATDPSADATNWAQQITLPVQTGAANKVLRSDGVSAAWGGTSLFRSARTSNTALTNADTGTLIDITSGTFTQTFAACATLGSGWFCYLKNSGTGDITLDPDGAELIDGLTGFVMYPGEFRMVQCDGLALRSVALRAGTTQRVVVGTGNSMGSLGTAIRRFTTLLTSVGSAISYADSATAGASFTINADGLYSIIYTDTSSANSAQDTIGISINSSQLSIGIRSITPLSRLAAGCITYTNSEPQTLSVVANLAAGDVIRPHNDAVANTSATALSKFSIQRVGV